MSRTAYDITDESADGTRICERFYSTVAANVHMRKLFDNAGENFPENEWQAAVDDGEGFTHDMAEGGFIKVQVLGRIE